LPVNASSGSQQYPDSGTTNSKPRLEGPAESICGPPPLADHSGTCECYAMIGAKRGKLTLEEIVDRICIRFEYFQDLQNRAKLKVGLASPSCNRMLIEMIDKY